MPLVIIESQKKIKRFVEYTGLPVIATGGHFRELPASGINVDLDTFEPTFSIIPGKEKIIEKLKQMVRGEVIYVATDPDREGAAFAHFIHFETSGLYKEAYRVEVREITKSGIEEAFARAVPFEKMSLSAFNAFLGKRVADRLVGYLLSPQVSKDLGTRRLSIGRVQTLALRLIVEREREIRLHEASLYWVSAIEVSKDNKEFLAYHVNGSFDDKSVAMRIAEKVALASYAVCRHANTLVKKSNPWPSFTTASMQMAASSKFGMRPEKTMQLALDLFEAGLITFHITDSVRLSDEIIGDIRALVTDLYGERYLPDPSINQSVKKPRVGGREGIRPTLIHPFVDAGKRLEDEGLASPEHILLYELIWRRTIASQMAAAVYCTNTVFLEAEGEWFKGVGRVLAFDGFQRVYSGEYEPAKKLDVIQDVPLMDKDTLLAFRGEFLEEKKRKSPPRYSEAGLIERLESLGVGRPSTYAGTLSSICRRGYVEISKKMLHPTGIGEKIIDWAEQHCNWLVDYDMTKTMEETLDQIEQGRAEWKDFVRGLHGRIEFLKTDQRLNENAPSKEMINYANKIGQMKDIKVPMDVMLSRAKLSSWIAKNKPIRPDSGAR